MDGNIPLRNFDRGFRALGGVCVIFCLGVGSFANFGVIEPSISVLSGTKCVFFVFVRY